MTTGSSTTSVDLLNMGPNGGAHSSLSAAMGMGKEGLVFCITRQRPAQTTKGKEVGFFFVFLLRIGRAHSIVAGAAWRSSSVDDPERLFTSWQHSEQRTQRNQSWPQSDLLPR